MTTSMRPPTLSEASEPALLAEVRQMASSPDPYPTYRRLRRDYPVVEILGAVHLTRYADVEGVLRHPSVSSDDRNSAVHQALLDGDRLTLPYLSQMARRSFLHHDPPEHTRLRRLGGRG